MVESGNNVPAPTEPTPVPLQSMDEDENEMEDIIIPNEDVDTMIMLRKHYILNYIMKQAAKPKEGIPYQFLNIPYTNRRNGIRDAETKSNQSKNEMYGLWWIVHQIENPSNVVGYSQRNQMEDTKPNVHLSEGRGQNNQQPTPKDNKK